MRLVNPHLVMVCFQAASSASNGVESGMPAWTGSPHTDSLVPPSQYSPLYFQVCREFQRGTCTRQPCECRFAHPPENVTVDSADNHVTVCMDYVKGKCSRDSCRYFHPPPHLQVQIKTAQQRANAAAAQAQALVGSAYLSLSSKTLNLILSPPWEIVPPCFCFTN